MGIGKPILVTGSHRSGTTWVGRMIAASADVAYIHEPFNLSQDRGVCDVKFNDWFTYVCNENAALYKESLARTLSFQYHLFAAYQQQPKFDRMVYHTKQFLKSITYRLMNNRPLMKDPIAIFSTEWLVSSFNMDPVILIRHPAAFVGSLKVKGWHFDFNDFLKQPLLMRDLLGEYEDEIRSFDAANADIVDEGALIWKLIYGVVLKYQEKYPQWIYVRHEDLSRDPLAGFRDLYQALNLEYTEKVQEIIKASSFSKKDSVHQRNSLENISTWKNRLSSSEINRIKSSVGDISKAFYADDEW